MNTSPSPAIPGEGGTALARVLVMAGAVIGFAVLAVLLAGRADATDRSAEPGDHGILGTITQADRLLRPVHQVAAETAPVVEQVTEPVQPVVAPVVRPVVKAAEPVLHVAAPITEPVTRPVVRALAPVTEPVTRAVGADPAIDIIAGTQPDKRSVPAPRADVSPAPAQPAGPATDVHPGLAASDSARETSLPGGLPTPDSARHLTAATPTPDLSATSGHGRGGGGPALPAGPGTAHTGGTMTAGASSSHGGEHAVTETGTGVPGTDRSWRAPPDARPEAPWPDEYGLDHPS
ncbi:hypothetical protein AB0N89_19880 [Amycolatopsis sp. NPDC089917]|uniref:hypothetical protein n=1 Tax=Amycolatopsis sp. NPDC089917 TaxID=3155187 RepID=UPI00342E277C